MFPDGPYRETLHRHDVYYSYRLSQMSRRALEEKSWIDRRPKLRMLHGPLITEPTNAFINAPLISITALNSL